MGSGGIGIPGMDVGPVPDAGGVDLGVIITMNPSTHSARYGSVIGMQPYDIASALGVQPA
jgi:hypothetical protein